MGTALRGAAATPPAAERGAYYTHVDGYELDTCGDDVWIQGGTTFRLPRGNFSMKDGR